MILPRCALSVDLESWVHRDFLPANMEMRKSKDNGYIKNTTDDLLNLLERLNRRLTFFVVSEIYEWYPDLINRIESCGHEIAHHTHTHRRLVSKQILTDELEQASRFLKKFKPMGFRAPEARLDRECFKILSSYGFKYDSSSYGVLESSYFLDSLREIPISSVRFRTMSRPSLPKNINRLLLTKELPLGSGFFLSAFGRLGRLVPDILRVQNEIPVMFVHPWQINPITTTQLDAFDLRSIAMQLYSRKCTDAFVRILNKFETVRLCDLMHELE